MRVFTSYLIPALCCFSMATALLTTNSASAQSSGDAQFYKGYYLQHQKQDFKGAIEAYKKATKLGANDHVLSMVDQQMGILQQELVSSDFASLMPANALGYIEINKPGAHVEKVCKIMGITGREFSAGAEKVTIRIEDGLSISSDFQISPALIREIKKMRGMGLAITEISEGEVPFEGVAVINPGESDLITGLLETGLQLVPAKENIGGYPTFNIENEIWVVNANRLIVVGTSKEHITNCLQKLSGSSKNSLADSETFQSARADNEGAAVFTYVSPKEVMAQYGQMFKGELAVARMVLDLDSMEHLSSGLMATETGMRSRIAVQYSEDHNSFGYGLIRTIPLTKKALKHIPSGSAAVVGLGLNPKMLLAAQAAGNRHLSALDIGRELFANIEEVGAFVLPSMAMGSQGIPDVGIVIASSDIEKSDSLWNQLLSLPSKLKAPDSPRVETVTIAGVAAQQYTFPGNDFPPLVLARIGEEAMVAGTRGAVEAALQSQGSSATLINDPRAAALWNSQSEFTSKAVFVNVGKAMELAARLNGPQGDPQMQMIASVIDGMAFTLVVNEAPAKFEIQTDLNGLPKLEAIIKAAAQMQSQVNSRRKFDPRADSIASPNDVIEARSIQQD